MASAHFFEQGARFGNADAGITLHLGDNYTVVVCADGMPGDCGPSLSGRVVELMRQSLLTKRLLPMMAAPTPEFLFTELRDAYWLDVWPHVHDIADPDMAGTTLVVVVTHTASGLCAILNLGDSTGALVHRGDASVIRARRVLHCHNASEGSEGGDHHH